MWAAFNSVCCLLFLLNCLSEANTMNVARYKIMTAPSAEELEKKLNEANAFKAISISSYANGFVALLEFIPAK